MPGRLDQIESLLRPRLGAALLARCPELVFSVNGVLVRFGRTDRLLALSYSGRRPDALLQDALFDFAREGSYAAMRELLSRYPLEAFDRAWIEQVLRENGQLE